ncbi:hypothetical protein [Hydrogenophaga sp.]|uniref:hypothetical protein n=1 Tax=Hydrogenophaga sp. TaxID=1904254 RepID=UPI0026036423|nr:hypothetical protein [Hydrogenophaga sp.]MDM7951447.1 hypothetical protein [Hydrogenophaga sp.]
MTKQLVGKVLRYHTVQGYVDSARIVHQSRDGHYVWIVPLPGDNPKGKGGKVFHIKAPRRRVTAEIEDQEDRCTLSLVEFVPPTSWLLPDHELEEGATASDLGRTVRKNLARWFQQREEQKSWIEPILDEVGPRELLECGRLNELVRARAKALGHKGNQKVARAMRLYLLGCGNPNALLPAWGNSGARGQSKFASKKAGRPRREVARGNSLDTGFICTKEDRQKLTDGWRKYKKRRDSVYDAYLLTCNEYWPGECRVKSKSGVVATLLPPNERPTLAQFKWAAKVSALSASRVNMGERVHELSRRALRGLATDGVVAVGQLGLIDSTSEDQTPVSSISRLKVLPSSWRSVLLEVKTGYILGLHCGFECPSALTSLLCILSSASSKVELCARYGVVIEEDEWHHRMCKRIRGDNGETKNELNLKTMCASEVSLEFVRSYRGDLKGQVEGSHHSVHRRADHKSAGSTKGEQRKRGEVRREDDACRTLGENMKFVIKAILRHNNEEPVEDLLTLDMRRDGVKPTRKEVYEWYLKNGYVASEPWNLDLLRAQCLPRLAAKIHRDGIHIFDPLDATRLIPNLRYASDWLFESGLCEKAGRSSIDCEVQLDPNDLSHCYFLYDGLKRLERKTSDPLANEISLCEHLEMTYDDKERAESTRADCESNDAATLVANRKMNKEARAAKRAEQASEKNCSSEANKKGYGKRQNKRDELKIEQLRKLGLPLERELQHSDKIIASEMAAPCASPSLTATEALMQKLRQAREAQ